MKIRNAHRLMPTQAIFMARGLALANVALAFETKARFGSNGKQLNLLIF